MNTHDSTDTHGSAGEAPVSPEKLGIAADDEINRLADAIDAAMGEVNTLADTANAGLYIGMRNCAQLFERVVIGHNDPEAAKGAWFGVLKQYWNIDPATGRGRDNLFLPLLKFHTCRGGEPDIVKASKCAGVLEKWRTTARADGVSAAEVAAWIESNGGIRGVNNLGKPPKKTKEEIKHAREDRKSNFELLTRSTPLHEERLNFFDDSGSSLADFADGTYRLAVVQIESKQQTRSKHTGQLKLIGFPDGTASVTQTWLEAHASGIIDSLPPECLPVETDSAAESAGLLIQQHVDAAKTILAGNGSRKVLEALFELGEALFYIDREPSETSLDEHSLIRLVFDGADDVEALVGAARWFDQTYAADEPRLVSDEITTAGREAIIAEAERLGGVAAIAKAYAYWCANSTDDDDVPATEPAAEPAAEPETVAASAPQSAEPPDDEPTPPKPKRLTKQQRQDAACAELIAEEHVNTTGGDHGVPATEPDTAPVPVELEAAAAEPPAEPVPPVEPAQRFTLKAVSPDETAETVGHYASISQANEAMLPYAQENWQPKWGNPPINPGTLIEVYKRNSGERFTISDNMGVEPPEVARQKITAEATA